MDKLQQLLDAVDLYLKKKIRRSVRIFYIIYNIYIINAITYFLIFIQVVNTDIQSYVWCR